MKKEPIKSILGNVLVTIMFYGCIILIGVLIEAIL